MVLEFKQKEIKQIDFCDHQINLLICYTFLAG
jgi:hypothetical protein